MNLYGTNHARIVTDGISQGADRHLVSTHRVQLGNGGVPDGSDAVLVCTRSKPTGEHSRPWWTRYTAQTPLHTPHRTNHRSCAEPRALCIAGDRAPRAFTGRHRAAPAHRVSTGDARHTHVLQRTVSSVRVGADDTARWPCLAGIARAKARATSHALCFSEHIIMCVGWHPRLLICGKTPPELRDVRQTSSSLGWSEQINDQLRSHGFPPVSS